MAITIRRLAIPDVIEIAPNIIRDERGFFSEAYNRREAARHGFDLDWVQDNHTLSVHAHVLRGLHYQAPPMAQDKLVRVLRGAILDIAVDIRKGSPTYLQHVCLEVSAQKWNQILVPKGFAHGMLTLQPETEVIIKVSQYFSPEHDRAIQYDDPAIGVDWRLGGITPKLSEKDRSAPPLSSHDTGFDYSR